MLVSTNTNFCFTSVFITKTTAYILLLASLIVFSGYANSADFSHKLDVQVRADDRSARDIRYQYRIRYRPQISFSKTWSMHAFAVTGDDYGSSHNTFDDNSADYFYMRRLFARHTGDYGKTEFGIIPTYKGRVSSSGLSKDGWIKGLRHVRALGDDNLEIVVGQLKSLTPSDALKLPETVDYIEVEYSAQISERWSYELSAERMTESNFLRSEIRYRSTKTSTYFAEIVGRLDTSKTKTVLGTEGEFALNKYPIEYFAHYSYVSTEFGLRAELTEDFLGTGHGFSGELSGDFTDTKFAWFLRYDAVKDRSRLLAGLSWSL